jgi:hypothetical protein
MGDRQNFLKLSAPYRYRTNRETYRLLLLSAELSRWTRPTPWFGGFVNSNAVLRIQILRLIHRIRMFLSLLDPDPDLLVRGMDPDLIVSAEVPDPDPSII